MPLHLQVKEELSLHSDRVLAVEFLPQAKVPRVLLAQNGMLNVWDYSKKSIVRSFWTGTDPVRCARFIVRKNWVVAGTDDMRMRVYNYRTKEMVKSWAAHNDFICYIEVHPTHPLLISCSGDATIKLWDWDRAFESVRVLHGHSDFVMMLKINPCDVAYIASCSLDQTIRVWNLNDVSEQAIFRGHEKGVNCISFFSVGEKQYLLSGSDDRTVRIWDYAEGQCVRTLAEHPDSVSCACVHPRLPVILTACEDGAVRVWRCVTYCLDATLRYDRGRVWALDCTGNSNKIAIGCDEGAVVVSLCEDEDERLERLKQKHDLNPSFQPRLGRFSYSGNSSSGGNAMMASPSRSIWGESRSNPSSPLRSGSRSRLSSANRTPLQGLGVAPDVVSVAGSSRGRGSSSAPRRTKASPARLAGRINRGGNVPRSGGPGTPSLNRSGSAPTTPRGSNISRDTDEEHPHALEAAAASAMPVGPLPSPPEVTATTHSTTRAAAACSNAVSSSTVSDVSLDINFDAISSLQQTLSQSTAPQTGQPASASVQQPLNPFDELSDTPPSQAHSQPQTGSVQLPEGSLNPFDGLTPQSPPQPSPQEQPLPTTSSARSRFGPPSPCQGSRGVDGFSPPSPNTSPKTVQQRQQQLQQQQQWHLYSQQDHLRSYMEGGPSTSRPRSASASASRSRGSGGWSGDVGRRSRSRSPVARLYGASGLSPAASRGAKLSAYTAMNVFDRLHKESQDRREDRRELVQRHVPHFSHTPDVRAADRFVRRRKGSMGIQQCPRQAQQGSKDQSESEQEQEPGQEHKQKQEQQRQAKPEPAYRRLHNSCRERQEQQRRVEEDARQAALEDSRRLHPQQITDKERLAMVNRLMERQSRTEVRVAAAQERREDQAADLARGRHLDRRSKSSMSQVHARALGEVFDVLLVSARMEAQHRTQSLQQHILALQKQGQENQGQEQQQGQRAASNPYSGLSDRLASEYDDDAASGASSCGVEERKESAPTAMDVTSSGLNASSNMAPLQAHSPDAPSPPPPPPPRESQSVDTFMAPPPPVAPALEQPTAATKPRAALSGLSASVAVASPSAPDTMSRAFKVEKNRIEILQSGAQSDEAGCASLEDSSLALTQELSAEAAYVRIVLEELEEAELQAKAGLLDCALAQPQLLQPKILADVVRTALALHISSAAGADGNASTVTGSQATRSLASTHPDDVLPVGLLLLSREGFVSLMQQQMQRGRLPPIGYLLSNAEFSRRPVQRRRQREAALSSEDREVREQCLPKPPLPARRTTERLVRERYRARMSGEQSIEDSLLQYKEFQAEKMHQRKIEVTEQQLSACTFHPNTQSPYMVSFRHNSRKPRSSGYGVRSVGSNASKQGGGGDNDDGGDGGSGGGRDSDRGGSGGGDRGGGDRGGGASVRGSDRTHSAVSARSDATITSRASIGSKSRQPSSRRYEEESGPSGEEASSSSGKVEASGRGPSSGGNSCSTELAPQTTEAVSAPGANGYTVAKGTLSSLGSQVGGGSSRGSRGSQQVRQQVQPSQQGSRRCGMEASSRSAMEDYNAMQNRMRSELYYDFNAT